MNKFQKALSESVDRNDKENYKNLKELVDRATQKKPLKENVIAFETNDYDNNDMPKGKVVENQIDKCPKCHKKLVSIKNRATKEQNHKFCSACGQAIDWSDEK